jgi:type III pantothenate kinase
MILAIDVGNTAIKLAVMDATKIHCLVRSTQQEFHKNILILKEQYSQLTSAAVCIVGNFEEDSRGFLETQFPDLFYIKSNILLPFKNTYQGNSLGSDRIALVSGALAHKKNNESAVLIIDAGTCITYDFMDNKSNYHGGAISPGLRMRYQSLHNFTQNLPLLEPVAVVNPVGNTTAASIHSGIVNGTTQEILGVINQYKNSFGEMEIFITGGDGELLVKQLKNRFFATPFLMLDGIYNLYTYNKKNL